MQSSRIIFKHLLVAFVTQRSIAVQIPSRFHKPAKKSTQEAYLPKASYDYNMNNMSKREERTFRKWWSGRELVSSHHHSKRLCPLARGWTRVQTVVLKISRLGPRTVNCTETHVRALAPGLQVCVQAGIRRIHVDPIREGDSAGHVHILSLATRNKRFQPLMGQHK